jgi:drug/metabolite transporter (DMT)-like permease
MAVTDAHAQRRLGVFLIIAAAVAWSTAPFFTRLLTHDSWTILFWRGVFASTLIILFLAATEGRAGLRNLVFMERSGWIVASLSTLAMVAFIPSLQMTSTANVAVIIATQPFMAAGLAWLWLREAARWRTLLASLVAFIGVVITVSQSVTSADLGGIALAFFMVFSFSLVTVAVRRYRQKSMVAAAAMSNLLGSLISLVFAQGIASVTAHDIGVLAMFGSAMSIRKTAVNGKPCEKSKRTGVTIPSPPPKSMAPSICSLYCPGPRRSENWGPTPNAAKPTLPWPKKLGVVPGFTTAIAPLSSLRSRRSRRGNRSPFRAAN